MRGNHSKVPPLPSGSGSIPARAGEPYFQRPRRTSIRVYPRACGGTYAYGLPDSNLVGLSPRVRGNHRGYSRRSGYRRSIPARAGEPVLRSGRNLILMVYPRACGGTPTSRSSRYQWLGLSPRVRGNRSGGGGGGAGRGSIPARAGEPAPPVSRYPPLRSIPARAGEPGPPRRCRRRKTVYPRACGGTGRIAMGLKLTDGLSPRVRGNQVLQHRPATSVRSIPARAGEPPTAASSARRATVYPRACGGTEWALLGLTTATGLSPRVRGNQADGRGAADQLGSIPARAGEPSALSGRSASKWVYLRACGGTPWQIDIPYPQSLAKGR